MDPLLAASLYGIPHRGESRAASGRTARLGAAGSSWIGRQCGRRRRQIRRMLLQFRENVVNTGLQLYVMSLLPISRRIIDRHVRIDPVVLDDPLRVEAVSCILGHRYVAAVQKQPFATNATYTAPGARAHQR